MQEEKKIVELKEETTYTCECPNCGETMYPEYDQIAEAVLSTAEITCSACETEFLITL